MNIENSGIEIIAENRKAKFNYHIIETFEAGIVLSGAEIKSLRLGNVSIGESYVRPEKGGLYWLAAHIQPYAFRSQGDYDPVRKRKLLMHRREIDRLRGSVERKGHTIVPLKIYFKRGYAKIELALAKGKSAPDKRQSVREREGKREAQRAIKERRQR